MLRSELNGYGVTTSAVTINPFTSNCAKSKTDKVLLNSYPVNGHTFGVCPWNQNLKDFASLTNSKHQFYNYTIVSRKVTEAGIRTLKTLGPLLGLRLRSRPLPSKVSESTDHVGVLGGVPELLVGEYMRTGSGWGGSVNWFSSVLPLCQSHEAPSSPARTR